MPRKEIREQGGGRRLYLSARQRTPDSPRGGGPPRAGPTTTAPASARPSPTRKTARHRSRDSGDPARIPADGESPASTVPEDGTLQPSSPHTFASRSQESGVRSQGPRLTKRSAPPRFRVRSHSPRCRLQGPLTPDS